MQLFKIAQIRTARRVLSLVVFLICVQFSNISVVAQQREQLFSRTTARTFHKIAYEIYTSEKVDDAKARQALIFLNSGLSLDSRGEYMYTDMLELLSKFKGQDSGKFTLWAFEKYIDENSDLHLASTVIAAIMDGLDTRQQREDMLLQLYGFIQQRNPVLASDVATELALLSIEKADYEAASSYMLAAHQGNPYNTLAFAKLSELYDQEGKPLGDAIFFGHLRDKIIKNPMDMESAFAFGQYAERLGLYDVAVNSYQYCADLFEHLNPGEPVPAQLYLSWAIANYNIKRDQANYLKIAEKGRYRGNFDLILEGITGLAASRVGNSEQVQRMVSSGVRAEQMLSGAPDSEQVTYEQLAWFYCFAVVDEQKALSYANKAFSLTPDSTTAKGLLAYALTLNDQFEFADSLIAQVDDDTSQLALLSKALIQIENGQEDQVIATLKTTVGMDPSSIAAEKARKLLAENGSEYLAEISPEIVLKAMQDKYGREIVPKFKPISEMFSVQLKLKGNEFSYGSELDAKVVVNNKSQGPLVVDQDGVFKGNVRVDARLSGDVKIDIPKLIEKTVRPSKPIKSFEYLAIPVDLMVGKLRQKLLTYPQASMDIEFTVFLDPVVDSKGKVSCGIAGMKPLIVKVKRQGVSLTREYLIQLLDSVSKRKDGDGGKIRALRIFAGLLAEQDAMKKSGPLYRYIKVERPVLVDAVRRGLNDESWTVNVQTIEAMLNMAWPMDTKLIETVSAKLTSDTWPVRMMSLYLLANYQGNEFGRVLDWTAQNDPENLVREMAVALGGKLPEEKVTPEPVQNGEESP